MATKPGTQEPSSRFPWEGIGQGYPGTGMATEIGYSVNPGKPEFWEEI
jgi:glyoxalase family protein